LKLLTKEVILPSIIDRFLSVFAPSFTFSLSLGVWAVIPFTEYGVMADG
jgi:NADH:ubiquinone oxidoreductase subunit H